MTAGLIAPGSEEFAALFTSFTRSAFRLETFQSYGNSGEDSVYAAFLDGEPYEQHPGKREWLRHIARAEAIGATMSRVHVVREPLSDYMRFETTWAYAPNVAAGEDIRIITLDAEDAWPADLPPHDYWLFDGTELYAMHYADDDSGTFLGVEYVPNHEEADAARTTAIRTLAAATPWRDWIAARPDLAAHVPAAS